MDFRGRLKRLKGLRGLKGLGMGIVVIVYFVGSLVLVNPAELYVSPDETANAFFAKSFSQNFSLRVAQEQYDPRINDRVHPRSVLSQDGALVPGSFLGLPVLYGLIVAVVGAWSLWILTPFITIAAAWCLKQIISRNVSSPIGDITFLFFLLHPAVWYYSARGLMHNMVFVDLLIFAVWMWIARPFKRHHIFGDILAGFFLGLAIFVRASEFAWIGAALIIAACIWWRALSLRRLRAGFFGLLIGLSLMFGMNALTYGHPFASGYTLSATPQSVLETQEVIDTVEVLPFGFHPRDAWRHFSSYGVSMFWWLSALSFIGFFVLFAVKKHRHTVRGALVIASAISIWLALMYGSWEIHDNPDPTQITMANSYARYWLPMYMFSTPLVAAAIVWISQRGRSVAARALIISILILTIAYLNLNAVFVQGQDGLLKMKRELSQSEVIQASVLAQTSQDALIIVDRADKLFFPHRRVMYPLRDDSTYGAMPELVSQAPLYYYGITLPEIDFDYLNQSRLKNMGLKIELIQQFEEESLYRIVTQ
jgi:hypothetical protein